jgi:hypothetical protein
MRLLSGLLSLALAAATLIAVGIKTQGDVMAQKFERAWPRTINQAEHHGGLYLITAGST